MINLPKFKLTQPTSLETELERIIEKMSKLDPNTDLYKELSEQYAKLYKLKEVDSKSRISPDAVLSAASGLVGIVVMMNHERAHVFASKAFTVATRAFK